MATVHLLKREPEQSTVLAEQALRVAKRVRSERVNTRLRKTVDTAARDFGDVAEVVQTHRSARRGAARDGRGRLSPCGLQAPAAAAVRTPSARLGSPAPGQRVTPRPVRPCGNVRGR